MNAMKTQIEEIYSDLTENKIKASELSAKHKEAIHFILNDLDQGKVRVCEKHGDEWVTNDWVKKAILCYFRIQTQYVINAGDLNFNDKIPLKDFSKSNAIRAVPGAIARYASFIESGVILMPSFVNIGAFVGTGTMVDTWATVGSCAQIGKNVHLSGGVGIGGVLEPLQARPVIIEDNCFIGSRSIVVEGVHVAEGAVIGAGVTLTGSTKIIDVSSASEKIYTGFVPSRSVVIPGSIEKTFPSGKYQVPVALIVGKRKASTDLKTSLNEALREHQVSV